jgi:AFG3 family protein
MRWGLFFSLLYLLYLVYTNLFQDLSLLVTTAEILNIIMSGNATMVKIDETNHVAYLFTQRMEEVYRQNSKAIFNEIAKCTVEYKTIGQVFKTVLPNYHTLEAKINELNITKTPPVHYLREGGMFSALGTTLLWYAVIFFALRYFMKNMGSSFTDNAESVIHKSDDSDRKVTMDDVAGLEEVKNEIQEYIRFLKHREKYLELGAKLPRGLLLIGEPGCGKTLLAKAMAGESEVNFLSVSGSDFNEVFVGVGASRVRKLFQKARAQAPCVIFIDEIDGVGSKRGMSYGKENDVTLNKLLVEMDGFKENDNILVIGATNREESLDSALLRSGRFDRKIIIDPPNVNERNAIFKLYLEKIKMAGDLELDAAAEKMAKITPGFSGADIANICNQAAIIAVRGNIEDPKLTLEHLEEAIDEIVVGMKKKDRLMSPEETQIVAHHEAGHALLGYLLKSTNPPIKVSIVPRGRGALGYSQPEPVDKKLYRKKELLAQLMVLYGGRIAEEIFFQDPTTGAWDDIKKATKLARQMVTQYGLSDLGARACQLEENMQGSKRVGPEFLNKVENEVQRILDEQYAAAVKLLNDCKDDLEKIAQKLLEKEVLVKADIVELVGADREGSVEI